MMFMKFWFGRRLKGRCGDATAMGNDFIRFCGINEKLNVGISEGCWICGFHVGNAASNEILWRSSAILGQGTCWHRGNWVEV